MTSSANKLHEALIEARVPPYEEDRAELREEIRITAMLLIAQELEFIANAVTNLSAALNKVVLNIDEVIQHEVREDPDQGG